MNLRLVLLSKKEVPNNGIQWIMSPFVNYVRFIEDLTNSEIGCLNNLGPSDAVMCVGGSPFKWLRERYHFGVRSENYSDCEKLKRLSIEGGAFIKEVNVAEEPTQELYNEFFSEDFTKKVEYNVKTVIVKTFERSMKFFDWLEKLPLTEELGFDYEASGFPLDRFFESSGFSIATSEISTFISLTDIRHELGVEYTETSTDERYNFLRMRLANFLKLRMDHVWTYNMLYEYQASHRLLFNVDLYNLCDASAINVITGNHLKKYSLKWSGQYYLHVDAWDIDFDYLSEIIDSMLFIEVGEKVADKHKELKVTKDNFEQTPEWAEICKRYPNYIDEFRSLILEYWGNAFMCIPSDILGKYCSLDSFYTLQLYLSQKDNYNEECWKTFLDNTRLGARLHASGLYINEPYRAKYERYCKEQSVYGIVYCAQARCYIKMVKHKKNAAPIKNYSQASLKLLEQGKFFNGNPIDIVKYILTTYISTSTDNGFDDGKLYLDFGEDFAVKFTEALNRRMPECKCDKIDEGIGRKRKIIAALSEDIVTILGIEKLINIDFSSPAMKRHIELEKYLYYERAYKELSKVCKKFLNDPNNVPEKIYSFGKTWELLDYSNFISNSYFKCKSSEENDEIAYEMMSLFPDQITFLTSMFNSTQQLTNTDKFYSSRNIDNINTAFKEYIGEWTKWGESMILVLNDRGEQQYAPTWHSDLYPDKVFDLSNIYVRSPKRVKDTKKSEKQGKTVYTYSLDEKCKEILTDFDGITAQTQFFSQYSEQYKQYGEPFDPSDLNDIFYFLRKFTIRYLQFKKYEKVLSTYINGMFTKTAKYVIEDKQNIPIREALPDEPGARKKVFVHYEVNTKSSKRWSSGFHTIISHSDIKNCLATPPTFNQDGSINYCASPVLMTYFDISSAEVKAAGFASGDKDLIKKFNDGEDIYIYSAKLYLGDGFDKLSGPDKKLWRKRFKTVFLGVLYGLGKTKLAERLSCSIEEASDIIQGLYKSFQQLRLYVDEQAKYPLEHNGYINTMLGDSLRLIEYEMYLKCKVYKDKRNLEESVKRKGVNFPIQGGTSSIMARGFFNNIRVSEEENWEIPLQPIITVHDSNTNYVPVSKIFDMREYYDKNYTRYCKNIKLGKNSDHEGINLLFDLFVGESYESAVQLNQVDKDTIEFTGSSESLTKLYDKIMNCPGLKVECSMKREELVPSYVEDSIYRMILEKGCSLIKDLSKYTIQFHRSI